MYAGSSPLELRDAGGIRNPVLTPLSVRDVPAHLVADPFMLPGAGGWHMFFEVVNGETRKGEIGLATSPDARAWKYERIVLAEPFHLSYPHVFRWDGSYYMIPESSRDHSIRLYTADDFPYGWRLCETLLGGQPFCDSTPFRHADRWWMFTEINAELRFDTLRLYSAGDLSGPWEEHPSSPVVCGDAEIARPAGPVRSIDGRLVRFAQDCRDAYGVAVNAVEISKLSSTVYAERRLGNGPVLRASASGWNSAGMHHLDPHELDDREWIACVDGWSRADAHPARRR